MENTENRSLGGSWVVLDEPQNAPLAPSETPEKTALRSIRQLSNVAQALENLIVQCGDHAALEHIVEFCRGEVPFVREILRKTIHA